MSYVPRHVTQADGSPSQWVNCWAAVGAWLARGASRGRRRPSPSRFRRWARKPPKTTGGLADISRGLRAKGLWAGRGRWLNDLSRAQMRHRFLADDGKLYAAESDFNVWPVADRCQADFGDRPDAYHMIGIVAGGTGREVRVMDPLCDRLHRVNVDDVIDAVITYNDEHSGEKRGTGDLIVIVPPKRTQADPPPDAPDEPDDDPEPADQCAEAIANAKAAGRESAFVQLIRATQAMRSEPEG